VLILIIGAFLFLSSYFGFYDPFAQIL
jgi:hypothetical protein